MSKNDKKTILDVEITMNMTNNYHIDFMYIRNDTTGINILTIKKLTQATKQTVWIPTLDIIEFLGIPIKPNIQTIRYNGMNLNLTNANYTWNGQIGQLMIKGRDMIHLDQVPYQGQAQLTWMDLYKPGAIDCDPHWQDAPTG